MKTAAEIWEEYFDKWAEDDIFGFWHEVVCTYMPYEVIKDSLREGVTREEWEEVVHPLTEESIIEDMRDYMELAWGKVEDHRGLSAGRSVDKFTAWLWLLEDNELMAFAQDVANYPQYGAPILAKISEKYGFPVPEGYAIENMIAGRPCWEGCTEGCGV